MKKQILSILAVLACAMAEAEVVARVATNKAGVPQIRVNGKVVRPRMFWGWRGDVLYDQVRLAASNGVDFVSFMAEKSAWRGENDYDWSELDAKCTAILNANPKALLIPRMKLETSGWWARKHPADVVTYGDGTKVDVPSISCRTYRRQACAFVAAMVRHLCETYPDNFAGIHPAAQNTSEFFYWNAWGKPWCGYDPGTREAFKAWRTRQGLPAAEVPTLAERRRDPYRDLPLVDPVKDRVLVDFRRFQQEEMADFVAEICAAARQASEGKKLVLSFYGYQWAFSSLLYGSAASGHYALQHLLDRAAKDIDILCSPLDYSDRGWGGVGHAMSATETVTRHGVLWLMEDDTRTYVVPKDKNMGCDTICGDLRQSQQVLRRNMAQHILRGFGSWWMDLGSSGWYADPELWKVMSEEAPLDRALFARKACFAPDVAAIVDEESMLYLSLGRISGHMVGNLRLALGRGGAPFGQYLLSDVLKNPLAARLQFFQSAWYLTEKQRAQLQAQRTAHPDLTRVWSWAPGYLSPKGADLGGVERLTGFKAKLLPPSLGIACATEEGLRRGLPKSWKTGVQKPFVGLIGVEATESETWARFEDGTAAVAVRATGKGGYEVFLGSPACPAELVRALEDLAGVHRYVKTGDAGAFAAEGVLSVFAGTAGGEVVLDTGCAEPVVDVLTGRQIAVGPVFTLKMEPGENRVLRFSAVPNGRPLPEQTHLPARVLTKGEGRVMQHFFDKSPISPSGKWVALLRLPYENKRAEPGDAAEVVLVDVASGEERKIATTRAWEHQIGACVMWGNSDEELYFNDLRVGEWEPFLVKLNPQTGARREYPGGGFVLSPDGTKVAGYNLKTVRRMNFYGYGAAVPESAMPVNGAMPEDDGLFVTDLRSGERTLVKSIAAFFREALSDAERRELADGSSYGFQVKWSPDGEWLLFVVVQALNMESPGSRKCKWRRMVFSCRPDGSEPHLALPWKEWSKGGHHLNFHPDSRTVTMNLAGEDRKLYLKKFDVFGATPTLLCGPLRGSGHPSVSPDGRYLVTDAYLGESVAYPDGSVPIRLIDLSTGREREIARVKTVTGEQFRNGEFRVDPHPAWSRDGKALTFNSFDDGTRRVMMLSLEGLGK